MAGPNHRRVTLSLRPNVADDLDYVASRLGISRSALASETLAESLGPLRQLLSALPAEGASPEEVSRRMRGASHDIIRDRLNHLRDVLGAIDDPDSFELTPCDDRPAGCSCDYSSGERVAPPGGCLVHGHRGA